MSNEIEDLGLTDVDEEESSADKRRRIIREGKRKLNKTPHANDKGETSDSAKDPLLSYEDQEESDRRSLQTTSMVIQAASLVLAFGGTFVGVFATAQLIFEKKLGGFWYCAGIIFMVILALLLAALLVYMNRRHNIYLR